MTEEEKQQKRTGREAWRETFPNGSSCVWFCGNVIDVTAPGPTGKLWSKAFRVSVCDNRKTGAYADSVKRGGRRFTLRVLPANAGYEWK